MDAHHIKAMCVFVCVVQQIKFFMGSRAGWYSIQSLLTTGRVSHCMWIRVYDDSNNATVIINGCCGLICNKQPERVWIHLELCLIYLVIIPPVCKANLDV